MLAGDVQGDDDNDRRRLVNGEDPNPVRRVFSPVLAFCGLVPKGPADDFFPPRHVASPLLQLAVLSERLVRTAARHPMLVALQYGGALFLAVCLGFIFQDLDNDLYGIQDRIGLLFFIPFCLVLLGMSSLPVWRDEHILFTHEQGNKRIYGFPAYFMSVLLFDIVLVRTIPPTFFAIITYNMAGLNKGCDYCLLYFCIILIFTNIISALISMAVGAFRFSTSFSNLIGALLALLFALFAGFLVSKKSMEDNVPFYLFDPLAYSYEALLINQFGDEITSDGNEFFYIVNGSFCGKQLFVAGNTSSGCNTEEFRECRNANIFPSFAFSPRTAHDHGHREHDPQHLRVLKQGARHGGRHLLAVDGHAVVRRPSLWGARGVGAGPLLRRGLAALLPG
jgi:hypothetical protein